MQVCLLAHHYKEITVCLEFLIQLRWLTVDRSSVTADATAGDGGGERRLTIKLLSVRLCADEAKVAIMP